MNYILTYPNLNFAHKTDLGPNFAETFEKHYHLIYEILYLVEGDVDLVLENKVYHLEVGDLAFIQPGQHHHVTPNPHGKYERYVLKFPEYKIPETLLATLCDKPTHCSVSHTVLPDLFKRMDWHYERYKGKEINYIMESVLTEILTYFCAMDDHIESDVVFFNQKMAGVVEYINENIAQPLKIGDICDHFHYSKSYICKEFAECMDVPIKQYIRTKKILLADSLLKTGMKPTAVSRQCGFSDYSTFFRDYSKIIGKPPSSGGVTEIHDSDIEPI